MIAAWLARISRSWDSASSAELIGSSPSIAAANASCCIGTGCGALLFDVKAAGDAGIALSQARSEPD
jgi:hypothetical protein